MGLGTLGMLPLCDAPRSKRFELELRQHPWQKHIQIRRLLFIVVVWDLLRAQWNQFANFYDMLYKCQRDWQNLQCLHWQWESSVSSLAMATSKSLGLRLKHRLVAAAVTVACSTVPLVCRNFSCTWNRWKWTQPWNWRLIFCKSTASPIFLDASRCKCWHVRCSCSSASLTAYLFQLSSGPGPCWFAAVAVATVAVATVAVADTVSPVQSRASPVSRGANVKTL